MGWIIKFIIIKTHNMALTDPTNETNWGKWVNRIVTIALALYNAVQYLMTHWASSGN